MLGQKSAIRPGSIFNRQGGSVFNQRRHAYYDYLQAHPEETKALLGDMLIGVTNFFRDREAFEALERNVIPHLVSSLQDTLPHWDEIQSATR
ncbi:hypothetical protein V0M98_09715 [Pseudomonas silesiensis]